MAGTDRGGQQGDSLLGEFLALGESLGWRECHVACAKLLGLFTVDDGPLGLMPRRE